MLRMDSMVWVPRADLGKFNLNAEDLKLHYRTGFGTSEREEILKIYASGETKVGIPRAYFFKRARLGDQWSSVVEDCRFEGEPVELHMKGELRPEQQPLAEEFLAKLKSSPHNGGIFQAVCGFGKTVVALWLLTKLGRKALVVVHTSRLLDQWIERVEEYLGFTPGVICQDRFEDDPPIVIAMLQTLECRKFPREKFREFGVVVIDETHRLAAVTWSEVVKTLPSKVRIGLTATPRRADKLDPVFFFHIGPVVAKTEKREMQPKIYFLPTKCGTTVPFLRNGKVNRARALNMLARDPKRNAIIVSEVVKAVSSDRKIMVLSDRIDQLYRVRAMLKNQVPDEKIGWVIGAHWNNVDPDDPPEDLVRPDSPASTAVLRAVKRVLEGYAPYEKVRVGPGWIGITGGESLPVEEFEKIKGVTRVEEQDGFLYVFCSKRTNGTRKLTPEELDRNQKRQVILASYGLAAEGLDVPDLDVLFLATPRTDVEQPVGRTLRIVPGKKQPIVVDLVDAHQYYQRLRGKRLRQYTYLKYEVAEVGHGR